MGGSFPLVQPSLSVENTLRGGSSPAKDRGCACAHEGSGLDAVATLTPGRERERETADQREGMSAQEPGSYHATFADAWGPQCQPLTNTVGGLGGPMA